MWLYIHRGGLFEENNGKLQENAGNRPRKVQQRRRRSRPGKQSFRNNFFDGPGKKEKKKGELGTHHLICKATFKKHALKTFSKSAIARFRWINKCKMCFLLFARSIKKLLRKLCLPGLDLLRRCCTFRGRFPAFSCNFPLISSNNPP